MKTRKRGRSPNQDCEECLPISKRITRLNIHVVNALTVLEVKQRSTGSSNTQTIDDCQRPTDHQGYSSGSGQNSPEDMTLPWQQNGHATCMPSSSHQGNNNNHNYLPCGSSQCDTIEHFSAKTSLQTYASHHGLLKKDLKGYKPELDKSENPHYYQINSVLYLAHLDKARRLGMDVKL